MGGNIFSLSALAIFTLVFARGMGKLFRRTTFMSSSDNFILEGWHSNIPSQTNTYIDLVSESRNLLELSATIEVSTNSFPFSRIGKTFCAKIPDVLFSPC